MTGSVDVTFLGHFAKDLIVVRGARSASSGGAVYYGPMALARLGMKVAVITRLAGEDFGRLDELRDAGIEVFATDSGVTSGIENTYTTEDMDRRTCRPMGFAGPFGPEEIPELATRAFILAPIIAGEVDLALLEGISRRHPGHVALDVQGFVRVRKGDSLVHVDWPDKTEGLKHVTFIKLDHAEAEVLTGETDIYRAVRMVAAWGPREVVLTHAAGVLVHASGQDHEASWRARRLDGRTGRGDTCFAAYCARRLIEDPERACRYAAALTSLKMENPGPFAGSAADVEGLIEKMMVPTR
ncbi:carbohydrate kinase [Thermodesulfobacteriota bacterium]